MAMKLMIVDDSNIMRKAIEKYLGEFKLELVGTAGDGEAALRLFDEAKPDLVTLDITMPRMDGLACLSAIMEKRPETKVLVISALKDPATGLAALKRGAKGFLTKPFTQAELRDEVEAICREET
jgi:two-component system chemotaxis response regulator CheY